MSPFEVDPGLYDRYRHSGRPHPQHRSLSGSLVRFVVPLVLLAGGGAALGLFHAHSDADRPIAVASAAVTGPEVFVAGLPATTERHSHDSGQVPKDIARASAAIAPLAPVDIVPTPVIDPRAEFFIGTGDGSNGAWSRP